MVFNLKSDYFWVNYAIVSLNGLILALNARFRLKTVFLNGKSSEINGSRISLKISQFYRTFCRTLGHPGQFLTVTDQLSYYLIICYHWLAVPNGPIRISIANELRLNDQFSVTLFHHFFRILKIDDVITSILWRPWFIFINLFILEKTKNGTTRK